MFENFCFVPDPKVHKHKGSHRRLKFDVSDVSLNLSLLGAELRIYRTSVTNRPPDEELALHIYLGREEKGYFFHSSFFNISG